MNDDDWRQNLNESGLWPFPEKDPPLDAPLQGHECLDGPYEGYLAIWLIGESRVLMRDLDGEMEPEWYELVEGDDAGLHWVRPAATEPDAEPT